MHNRLLDGADARQRRGVVRGGYGEVGAARIVRGDGSCVRAACHAGSRVAIAGVELARGVRLGRPRQGWGGADRRVRDRERELSERGGPSCGRRRSAGSGVGQRGAHEGGRVTCGADAQVDAGESQQKGDDIFALVARGKCRVRSEPLSSDGESRGGVTCGVQAVVPDLDEARGQDVLDEAREQFVTAAPRGVLARRLGQAHRRERERQRVSSSKAALSRAAGAAGAL